MFGLLRQGFRAPRLLVASPSNSCRGFASSGPEMAELEDANPFTDQGNDSSILRILILGPPGAGKGTYSNILAQEFDLPHISSGDIARAEIASGSELGKRLQPIVESGELMDDSDITPLLFHRLMQPDTLEGHKFILDGFPRTTDQASYFVHEWLLDTGYAQAQIRSPFHLVVNLVLPEDILVAKITGRRQCGDCGRSFNLAHISIPEEGIDLPPLLPKKEGICDDCGSELFQRLDDVEETVRDRIALYNRLTAPVADFYRNQQDVDGRRFLDLNVAGGKSSSEPALVAAVKELQAAIRSGEEQERWFQATQPEAVESWV